MYCICCKNNIVKPIVIDKTEEECLWRTEIQSGVEFNVNNEMVANGIINIIEAGYGSKHDGDKLIIAICDECIDLNLQDATILYYGSSGSYYPEMIEEDVERSKKAYRRRKNLDELI